MRLRHKHPTCILSLLLLAALLVVPSCAPTQVGPRAWIDWPLEGFETEPGSTVNLIAHAYAEDGVTEVRLEVDRQPYRVVSPDPAGEQFVEVSAAWFAEEPGLYLLSVIAVDAEGQTSGPADVTVRVTGEVPEATVTPGSEETPLPPAPTPEQPVSTMAPAETAPPPTPTSPPPTGTRVPPTATAPAPTATPQPPRIVSFEVRPQGQIIAGECVRFEWRVEGSPTAIYFDGEGVTSPDSMNVCPPATKDFVLRAEGPGGVDTESLTVVVIQPSPTPKDTQGPLIQNETGPDEMWAPDGGSCRETEPYLFQANVSDPSGVLMVKLVYSINDGAEQTGGMQLVSGSTYRIQYSLPNLQGDGGTFRWRISACDKVNPMNCRDSETHTISILDCLE